MSFQLDLFSSVGVLPTISQLSEDAARCTSCALRCPSFKETVFSAGIPTARVMIVSEAPSALDQTLGHVYADAAGELLHRALRSTGLSPEKDVYLTNICKHRPPSNRSPTAEEAKICSDLFFRKELEIVNPRIILCLGVAPLKFFNPRATTTATERGKWCKWNTSYVLTTFELPYIARNPDRTKGSPADLFWEDWRMLKRAIDTKIWES